MKSYTFRASRRRSGYDIVLQGNPCVVLDHEKTRFKAELAVRERNLVVRAEHIVAYEAAHVERSKPKRKKKPWAIPAEHLSYWEYRTFSHQTEISHHKEMAESYGVSVSTARIACHEQMKDYSKLFKRGNRS